MLIHWIWLATRPALTERQTMALLHTFADAEDVFFASRDAYANVEGVTPEGAESLSDKELAEAQRILDEFVRNHIGF